MYGMVDCHTQEELILASIDFGNPGWGALKQIPLGYRRPTVYTTLSFLQVDRILIERMHQSSGILGPGIS